MTQKNAYQATFQRNPGFNETEKGSYGPAKIKNITLKFNGDRIMHCQNLEIIQLICWQM